MAQKLVRLAVLLGDDGDVGGRIDALAQVDKLSATLSRERCGHSGLSLRERVPVRRPEVVQCCGVGLPEWARTAGLYGGGLLAHEYGVDRARMQWVRAGVREPGRVGKVELKLPPGVKIQRIA